MKKILLINLIIFISILLTLEFGARIFIKIKLGDQNAGLPMINKNLEYKPFVMYGENWDLIFNEFNKKLDRNNFNVLLIGGSTAESFPEKILEKSLQNKISQKVKVFNAGYGGYISTQELILLTRYAYKLNPDLIININGANDIIHSLKKNVEPGTFYLNNTYNLYLTKPLLGPIFKILQSSQLYNAITRLTERKEVNDYRVTDYAEHLNVYIENILSMSIFCDGLGIKYLNILQPHVIFKNIKHNNEKRFTLLNYRNEIVKKMYKEIKDRTFKNKKLINNFLDSTNIFENNSEHIFSDDVHFIRNHNKGYYILAEFISDNVIN
jgi:lysophospholipase L1-like esterase